MMKLPVNDHHLEIEQEEEEELISTPAGDTLLRRQESSFAPNRLVWNSVIGFLVLLLVLVALPSSQEAHHKARMDNIEYQCPTFVQTSQNDVGEYMNWYYRDDAKHSNDTLEDLKKAKSMDGWGHSYVAMKRTLRPWKEQVFVPNIKSGDHIYESACGSGLNLLMTAEILREYDILNLTVYGNDYVAPSVAIANRVWNSTDVARHGNLCLGDSTNLSFLPSNAFDFVFTGYIDPLVDPLSLTNATNDDEDVAQASVDNCISNETDKQELSKKEQRLQQDWYASWMREMIRVAKPGKVIVVESTCESLCTIQAKSIDNDWGGVDKEWWNGAITSYGWNVDPSSLVIEDELVTKEWKPTRYHVMMRKKT